MRHPSEYSTTPILGLRVMEVDEGTIIKDERSGEEATVTDSSFVKKGNVIFCTKKTADLIREKVPTYGNA